MLLITTNRKILATLILGLLLFALTVVSSRAGDISDDPGPDAGTDTGYVVVALKSPGAVFYEGGIKNIPATAPERGRFDPSSKAYAAYQKHLDKEQANFRSALARLAPQAQVVRSFHATANAVVVQLNGLAPGDISTIRGAKKTYDVRLYRADMDKSVILVNAPPAWAAVAGGREDAGLGVKVAVIDSGIVNSLIPGFHPFFNCKSVEFGNFYFSGVTGLPAIGIKNENGVDPAPGVAFVSTHGTHVSGTAGGCVTTIAGSIFGGAPTIFDGTELSGVAPGATLVDRNVFPGIGAGFTAFGGSAFSHDIAAAIEDAVLAGEDVINMSLGGGVQGPHDFLAEASNAAMAAGVVVVTSAGNAGPGPFTIGSPGSAADIITVGATTNARGMGLLVLAPGFPPIEAFGGEFPDFDGSNQTLIDWPGTDNLACDGAGAGGLAGEVVLIERGVCSFSQKMANAKSAGAGGAIVFTDSRDPGGMAKTPGFDDDIPAVMIARAEGLALESALVGGASLFPTVITPPSLVPQTPNLLAGFSSRGPVSFTGIIKPDLVATGVNVLSSVFTSIGWEFFNGTSMASPHVAGSAAVLLAAKDWTPAQVKSALATTATDLGLAPWEQGSGLLNLEAALNTNAFFSPTNASFGVFTGKAPANGSVEVAIDSGVICSLDSVTGAFVDAFVSGNELTVNFTGGRAAPTAFHGGFVTVDCDGQTHTIPWGAVVDR